jgi:hypothetical protein
MTDVLELPQKHNGVKGAVSARALARLRSQSPDEAAKVLADVLAQQRPIKPTKQLLSTASGVSIQRISKAQNGSRPRRPGPSPKTLAELRALLAEAESILNSTSWWNEGYRETELAFLDRRFAGFNVAHDIEAWKSLGALPATLAAAFRVASNVIATAANSRVG